MIYTQYPYPWSDMSFKLLKILGEDIPQRATLNAVAYCEEHDLLSPGGDENVRESARLTLAAVSSWLHGRRQIIDISDAAKMSLLSHGPRFEALPPTFGDPWMRGVIFRLDRGTANEIMIYVEPVSGRVQSTVVMTTGIHYLLWSRTGERWGTSVSKDVGMESLPLETFSYLDYLSGHKSVLAITNTGERIDLRTIRTLCINALAVMYEEPKLVIGERRAPTAQGKAGHVQKVTRLTLNEDATRLVINKWTIIDKDAENKEKIKHSTHNRPCLHTVEPHYWRVWVNKKTSGEDALSTRTRTRTDGTAFTQYRVSRLRGKSGAYTRGGEVKALESRIVTGPTDI